MTFVDIYIHKHTLERTHARLCLAYISRLTPKSRMICRLMPKSCLMYAGLRLAKTFVFCCPDQLNKRLADSKGETNNRDLTLQQIHFVTNRLRMLSTNSFLYQSSLMRTHLLVINNSINGSALTPACPRK